MNKVLKAIVYLASISGATLLGGFYGAIDSGLRAHHLAKEAITKANERVEKSKLS